MKPFESVLAATDFSDSAGNALARAACIAAEHSAPLALLHVMSSPLLERMHELFRDAPEAEARQLDEARQALSRLAHDIAPMQSLPVESRVATGVVLDEILAAAGAGVLLVMGARGLSPLRDAMLGTTAERLLGKRAGLSLVAKRAPEGPYRRVVVPVDYSEGSAAVLAAALAMAPDAEIRVCHAYDAPFEGKLWLAGVPDERIANYRDHERQRAFADMDALLAGVDSAGRTLARAVEQGDPSRVILAQEAAHGADLIVMGKHGRWVVEELFLGSVTRHVLANSKCDVLVVHEPRTR